MDTPNRFRNNRRAKSVHTTLLRSCSHAYHGTDFVPWARNRDALGGWVGAQGLLLMVRTAIARAAGDGRTPCVAKTSVGKSSRPPESPARPKPFPNGKVGGSFASSRLSMKPSTPSRSTCHRVDGRPLPIFLPGQYLTFRLHPPNSDAPVVRCYSLSDYPHDDFYRCTIKLVRPPARSTRLASRPREQLFPPTCPRRRYSRSTCARRHILARRRSHRAGRPDRRRHRYHAAIEHAWSDNL